MFLFYNLNIITTFSYDLDLIEIVIKVIRKMPVSSANAIEILAITKKFEDQRRICSTTTDLKQRLVKAMTASKDDILKFWSENKDNKDLVLELFEFCVDSIDY